MHITFDLDRVDLPRYCNCNFPPQLSHFPKSQNFYIFHLSAYLWTWVFAKIMQLSNKTDIKVDISSRVVNRHPEIRTSKFGPDIRIWKYPYDNWKRSANSQGLRRMPGHCGESRQLIQWNMIRCISARQRPLQQQTSFTSETCSVTSV